VQTTENAPNQNQLIDQALESLKDSIAKADGSALTKQLEILLRAVNRDNANEICGKVIAAAVEQMNQLISDQLPLQHSLSPRQISACWTKLAKCREVFSSAVSFAELQAQKFAVEIPEDLCVQAHVALRIGPEKHHIHTNSALKLLEQRLEFSNEFEAYDAAAKEKIINWLKDNQTVEIIEGTSRRSLHIGHLCKMAMEAYGFTHTKISTSEKSKGGSAFHPTTRTIEFCKEQLNRLDIEQRVFAVLHEIRHAIQFSFIDNYLFCRRDGSKHLYAHETAHSVTREFPRDLERMFLFAHANNIKSDLIHVSTESAAVSYSQLPLERDADRFAAEILSKLRGSDAGSFVSKNGARQEIPTDGDAVKRTKGAVRDYLDLILPSHNNAFQGLDFHRQLITDLTSQEQNVDFGNSEAGLTLPGRPEQRSEERPSRRDEEQYERLLESLIVRTAIADFSSEATIAAVLPELEALAKTLLCGHDGLRALHNKCDRAMNEAKLSEGLRERLSTLISFINKTLAPDNHDTKLPIKLNEILEDTSQVEIPVNGNGRPESLSDSLLRMLRALKEKKPLEAATLLRVVEQHIEISWLGREPRICIELMDEIPPVVPPIADAELKKAFEKRIAAVRDELARQSDQARN
jgi:hypothetical protein